MSGWIEADTDLVLRLMIGEGGATVRGVSDRALEIVNADLEVQHHPAAAGRSEPAQLDRERRC